MRHLKLIGMRCNLDQPEIPAALQFGVHYQIGVAAHLVYCVFDRTGLTLGAGPTVSVSWEVAPRPDCSDGP